MNPRCPAATPFNVVKDGRPLFKPEQYFAGRTHSWGVFETRSGQPTKLIHTQTTGRWEGDSFKFEQDLQIQGSKPSHRSWAIRRLDARHYSATGTGIVGVAHAEAQGNAFHLDFTIDAVPGNPLAHLHMSQRMYLQPDGVTMVNATLSPKPASSSPKSPSSFTRIVDLGGGGCRDPRRYADSRARPLQAAHPFRECGQLPTR